MVALKATVGWMAESLRLLVDTLHSVTDSANSVRDCLANPHPDRDYPYSHHKFESIGALGIACLKFSKAPLTA